MELFVLSLSNNIFEGTLPQDLFLEQSIRVLNLSSNSLQGTISSTMINLVALETLDLSYNLFEGNLAGRVNNAKSLILFFVQGNQFSGKVYELFTFPYQDGIFNIDLSDNQFSGKEIKFIHLSVDTNKQKQMNKS